MAKKAKAAEPAEEPRIEYVRLPDIAKAKRNPKNHDLPAIMASIRRHGFVDPLVENSKTGRIVAGHGRTEAVEAIKAETPDQPPARIKVDADGEWMLPVLRGVSFPNEQRAEEYLLGANKLVELGGWNTADLAPMLADIAKRGAEAIAAIGWQTEEITEIVNAIPGAPPADADPGPQPPPNVPTSRLGDLWILGDHRLLCGSSSNEKDVARLMDGQKAVLMATDPPYGVDYSKVKAGIPGTGYASERFKDWGDIENDVLNPADLRKFMDDIMRAAMPVLAKGVAFYVWYPAGPLTEVFRGALSAVNILIHRQVIWAKPGFVMTRSGMYHWAHETAFYGWIQGNVPPWYGEKNQTSVWHIGRDSEVSVHPTQKPVEIFAIPMRNHTKPNEVCYEPFSGSGTQIIAGEQLGRRVFAMEIDPKYVDAAVGRWEKMTGKKAILSKGAKKPVKATAPRKASAAPRPPEPALPAS